MTILYQITGLASNALSRLQEVLDTEKGKLTAMIAGLADGVFMVNSKNELLIINDAAKRFLGIEKKDPSFFDLLSYFNKYYDLVGKLEIATNQNRIIEDKEVKINQKIFQIYITPVTVKREKETVFGASVLIHDITFEKEITSIKEDFTNMIVHDLRTPLVSIKDASHLLSEAKEKYSENEKQQIIAIIQKQSKKLLDQIASILDASKIEAGRFSVFKSTNNIQDLLEEIKSDLNPIATKRDISLNYLVSQGISNFNFDKTRIEQAITNILANSFKFTPQGGRIDILARKTEDDLIITISDTGIGIPKEKQSDLFSKYYQIKKTPDQFSKGTGLGLYIAKGIVKAHGGRIWVNSEEGKGTEVGFTLPIQETENNLTDKVLTFHSPVLVG